MTHINECSWSRIGHPEELFTIGQKQKLKIIKIDTENKKNFNFSKDVNT